MPIDYNRPPKRPQGGQPPAAPPPAAAPPQAPPPGPPAAPPTAPPVGGQPSYPPQAPPQGYPPPAPAGYPPPAPQGYPPPQGQQPPQGQYPPQGAPPQGQPGGVNLSKVTLTKQAPAVSLSKQGGSAGMIRVNLNWTQRQGGGFFKRLASSGDIDLDLGCMFEFTDGDKGVVQALGNAFEAIPLSGGAPLIRLDGDDRSGTSQGGENMFIDLSRANMIRRILIFAYIYEGTPNWAAANGVVTIFPQSGPQIEVRLDESDPRAPMCAIALLTNQNGEIVINREVRYVRGAQRILDQTYGWGLNWTPGRK